MGARSFQSSDVSDVMDKIGVAGVLAGLLPVIDGSAVEGSAMPVLVRKSEKPESMRAGLIRAIDATPKHSVLVLSSESDAHSVWGGYTSWYAKKNHLSGAIVAGGVRDVMGIRKLRFPVFAKVRTPVSGTGRLEVASVGDPVVISGVVVRKGDWVVADSDGVVAVPEARAEDVRLRLAEIKESESRDKNKLTAARRGRVSR